MKLNIPVKKMINAIENGGIASLTKESQDEERKRIRPTDACVKISFTESSGFLTFESSSPKISVLYSIPMGEDIKVDKDGSFCVDTETYLKLLGTLPPTSNLSINYSEDKVESKDEKTNLIQANGKITTISKSEKAGERKGKNETFPVGEFSNTNYDSKDVLFTIKSKQLQKAISSVAFSVDSSDLSDLLDRIAIVIKDGQTYFAGTDGRRCAVWVVEPSEIEYKSEKAKDLKMLINAELLSKAVKVFDDGDNIDFIDCGNDEHVILSSPNTKIRMCIASAEVKDSYPNFIGVVGIQAPYETIVDKDDMVSAINFVTLYNQEKCVAYIKDGETSIKIEPARRGEDPEHAIVNCEKISKPLDNPVAISNEFLSEVFKKIDGDKIKISFTAEAKKIKIESLINKNFVYLMQSMTNS